MPKIPDRVKKQLLSADLKDMVAAEALDKAASQNWKAGNLGGAMENLQRSLQLWPTTDTKRNIGLVFLLQGKRDQALGWLLEAYGEGAKPNSADLKEMITFAELVSESKPRIANEIFLDIIDTESKYYDHMDYALKHFGETSPDTRSAKERIETARSYRENRKPTVPRLNSPRLDAYVQLSRSFSMRIGQARPFYEPDEKMALRFITIARGASPHNPALKYYASFILANNEKFDEARKLYDELSHLSRTVISQGALRRLENYLASRDAAARRNRKR